MISRNVSLQFKQDATTADIARFMHKLNIAISNRVHGKILQYTPPREVKRLILECPLESLELAEALEMLPADVRGLLVRVDVFEELMEDEHAATG